MNNAKQLTLDWILKYNRTPYPYSLQSAALKGLKPKQPCFFSGRDYLKPVDWKDYQDWGSLDKNFRLELIKTWHGDERIEGIGCNAGWNGEFYFSMIDIDRKTFESLEMMEQAIAGWENRNPGMSLCPRVKTQSRGYRYYIGFESVPKDWGNTISFTFTQGGEKSLGELMTGPGGLGIILGKGLKEEYLWDRNPCGEVLVFPNPESIGLYQVEKAIAPSGASIYDQTDTPEQAREALSFIPVNIFDGDYQGWINIGMACHSAGLDFEDWDNWSQGSKSYSNSKDTLNHWKSFNNSGGITVATLFKFAKDNGYKPPRQQQQNTSTTYNKPNYKTSGNTALKPESKQKKPTEGEVREALTKIKNILLDFDIDDISQEIKIDQIRQELGIDGKLWDKLRAKINREVRADRMELELRTLLLIDDKIKLTQGIHDLSEKYRIAVNSISNLLKELKLRNTTQQFEVMGLDDFFDETSDAVDYLIPGLLPKGESALLVAPPKVGKTLLAINLAFAVATGEDYFLGEKTLTGRVLFVSVDESKQSTKAKLIKRGFRKSDAENIRIITQFEVSQLEKLEAEIEDFHPTLVIIDSLKRITKGSTISENSAEFSDVVYTISELCNRYGASTVLIHHSKKDNETIGVDNVRGSSAIVGALGNVWLMNRVAKEDPNNKKKFIYDPKDTRRQLYCYSRDSEGKAFNLEFNPENNSWDVTGEVGISDAELDERKNNKGRILSVMRANLPHYPEGLKGSQIFNCLDLEEPGAVSKSSMYIELTRLVNAKLIGSKPLENSRGSLYFLFGFGHTTKTPQTDTSVNDEPYHKNGNIPTPPPLIHPEINPTSETTINKEFELGYKENNFGYKLVTSDFCNQGDVTNGKPQYEGVSDTETELVTSFGYKGGGGCAPDFATKTDEPKTYTTIATDVTTFGDRIPKPIENKITDFDGLDIGDVLIAEFKELHIITARKGQQWLTHRGEYVSRTALQNQDFKVPTIGEMVTAIGKAYVNQDSELAHLLAETFKNDPLSLFCQAIATDKNLEIIYTL